jgi:hypothetical protein
MRAGYSGTPLAKKLGIKESGRIHVLGAPVNYDDLLAPLPKGVLKASRLDDTVDVLHVFTVSLNELSKLLKSTMGKLRADAAIWVSWPKKASKVATDITEDRIRDIALPLGLVDIKVCAVDEVWSGLKLVVRKELRNRVATKKEPKKNATKA